MPAEDDVDIYLRFCEDENGKTTFPGLIGESLDALFVGDPFERRKSPIGCDGCFRVRSFNFSVSGSSASSSGGTGSHSSSGGAGARTPAPAAASGQGEAEGRFGGVSVTMGTQYGSLKLLQLCTEFAQPPGTAGRRVDKIKKVCFYARVAGQTGSAYAASGSGQDWYLGVFLFGVTIQSFAMGSSGEDSFTLNYEKMQVMYYPTDLDNKDPTKRILSASVSSFAEWNNAAPPEE